MLRGARCTLNLFDIERSVWVSSFGQYCPTVPDPGVSSRSNSICFPAVSGACPDRPVMFPPGRAKLATIPEPTGSPAVANTMGILDVACFATSVGTVLWVTMRSTFNLTNSAANSANRSLRPSAHRYAIFRLPPSVQPSCAIRRTNAVVHSRCAASLPEPSNPMVRTCCACRNEAIRQYSRAAQ